MGSSLPFSSPFLRPNKIPHDSHSIGPWDQFTRPCTATQKRYCPPSSSTEATPLTQGQFLVSSSFCWVPSSSAAAFSSISSCPFSIRKLPLSCSYSRGTPTPTKTSDRKTPLFSEGRDEDEARLVCPGCGVFMQDANPDLPGFYQKPVASTKTLGDSDLLLSGSDDFLEEDDDLFEEDDDERIDGSTSKPNLGPKAEGFSDDVSMEGVDWDLDWDLEEEDKEDEDLKKELDGKIIDGSTSKFKFGLEIKGGIDDGSLEGIDWDSDWEIEDENEEEALKKELDGFAPPGVGYGNITDETLKKLKKEKISKAEKKRKAREAKRSESEESIIVCARCHSLRNYGHVKNLKADNLIPDFDFDRLIATRLMRPATSAPLVVMVVDCVDFDGSFPKRAARSLFKALEGSKREAKLMKLPKLVLVATKVDLLPSQVSPTRLDRWVRNRAKSAGAPKLSGVYLVSSRKDLGVRNLLSFIKELAGPRGNVWVIGAQNAGKSTLINLFAKREGVKVTKLTEAPVPGTTLGILRIAGILPAKAKMYDTPGLLHPYLMTMRLNREEQKMVEIRKELHPRTYRMKVGQTVHVGGLMRLDLTKASVETIYISVWASPNVSLHMGKTENADEIQQKHTGIRLQPPIGQDRLSELGDWKPREIKVSGISWEVNSLDIAVSGLGWFSLGLKGEATVMLWTFDGVEVTEREPLVIDRAPFLERPGFLLPKAVSDAIGKQSRIEAEGEKLKEEREDFVLEANV